LASVPIDRSSSPLESTFDLCFAIKAGVERRPFFWFQISIRESSAFHTEAMT
jgi:hypothetical protein